MHPAERRLCFPGAFACGVEQTRAICRGKQVRLPLSNQKIKSVSEAYYISKSAHIKMINLTFRRKKKPSRSASITLSKSNATAYNSIRFYPGSGISEFRIVVLDCWKSRHVMYVYGNPLQQGRIPTPSRAPFPRDFRRAGIPLGAALKRRIQRARPLLPHVSQCSFSISNKWLRFPPKRVCSSAGNSTDYFEVRPPKELLPNVNSIPRLGSDRTHWLPNGRERKGFCCRFPDGVFASVSMACRARGGGGHWIVNRCRPDARFGLSFPMKIGWILTWWALGKQLLPGKCYSPAVNMENIPERSATGEVGLKKNEEEKDFLKISGAKCWKGCKDA